MSAANSSTRNLVGWVKLDVNGVIIPSSLVLRPQGVIPKDGNWKQITISYCCSCNCIITIQNNATRAKITSIVTADNAIDWSGTLSSGQTISFVIPNCYDENFTLTFGTVASGGIDIEQSVVQGTGTATVNPTFLNAGAAGQTCSITTTPGGCAQYLITIIDD